MQNSTLSTVGVEYIYVFLNPVTINNNYRIHKISEKDEE